MESLGGLEVETEINTNPPIKEELNVGNNSVENMKAFTDLHQHTIEGKTDCSLGTENSLDNHSRYDPEEDHWRSHSASVINDGESRIHGDESEKDCKTLTFSLNASSPDEDVPPEFEKVFVKVEDVSASEEERDEQMSWNEQPSVGQEPQPGCSSWSDYVGYQRGRDLDSIPVNSKELDEDRLGACDPLVTNDQEAAVYCVGSEKDNRTLISCSNTITLKNTLTIDDEVYACGIKQEEYVSTPVVVLDKEFETPTMKQGENKMFIATHSELNKTQNYIKDRIIMRNCVCDSCDFETSSLKILERHKMREHSDKKAFHCKFCDYKCFESSSLKRHERTHTGEKQFHCDFCDYKCSTSYDLKLHERTHTGEKPFHCDFCDYKCCTSSHLKRHERTHTGEKPFHCKLCNYKCSQRSSLKTHERSHTGEKPFDCKLCDYKCSQLSHLRVHERVHTGEKPFLCKFCDFKCSIFFNLKEHERTHTDENPLYCKFCNYKCSHRSNLITHERTHTGEKPYHCEFCDYKCSQRSSLKTHERTHTGEKPFHCKVCDYKCSTSSHLRAHERTHTGENPFHCKSCDYKCSTSSHLKTHERTHTGEKPFNCKFCDYKCSTSSNLKAHERTHTGENLFHCKSCDYKCCHSSQLKRHERTHTFECT